jgi:hypothetical protein
MIICVMEEGFAGAVGSQLPSVGHFRVLRVSQGTDCGCVVMSLNAGRALPVPLLAAHRIQTNIIRLNSQPIIRHSLRTH